MKIRIPGVCLSILLAALLVQSLGCQSQFVTSTAVSTISTTAINIASSSVSKTTNVPSTTISQTATSNPSSTPVPQPPVVLPNGANYFTKLGFVAERFRDTAAFDKQYNSTIFQVTGKIIGIDTKQGFLVVDDGSVPSGYAYNSAWQCFFQTDLDIEPNIGQIMDLKVGQSVTVQGTWGFRVVGQSPADPVYLGNCNLIGVS
jgi:hypothetical protein